MATRSYRFRFYLNARHNIRIGTGESGIHPHTWEFVLYIKKEGDTFWQFSEIENEIHAYFSEFEGCLLNETPLFSSCNPTMENIGDFFFEKISAISEKSGWLLESLEISENPARTYIVSKNDKIEDSITRLVEATGLSYELETLEPENPIAPVPDKLESEEEIIEMDKGTGIISGKPGDGSNVLMISDIKDGNFDNKTSLRKNKKFLLLSLCIILPTTVVLILYITGNGAYPWGSDTWGHIFKADLLYKSIKSGNIFPLYTDLWYNGIQPFRYWAPFPYYLYTLFLFISHGSIPVSYSLFMAALFITGAFGWVFWGIKTNRQILGLLLGFLWFFIPDNLRVLFSEGNLPRAAVGVIFPYLLLAVWLYVEKRKRTTGLLIAVLMFLITLCHAMIAAMAGITMFAFLLWYGLSRRKLRQCLEALAFAVAGIMLAGVWLYPALKGGMFSIDQGALSSLALQLSHPLTQSLNPLIRLTQNREAFYFGLSVIIVSFAGLLFGNKKSRGAFGLVILFFIGTLSITAPLIEKMPLNQLFWMERFTPFAMGIFFVGLLFWDPLRKSILISLLLLVAVDCFISFSVLAFGVTPPAISEDLEHAVNLAGHKIAVLDLSTFGSYPGYYLSDNPAGKNISQVYGWAWQGAETSGNIVWINTAVENNWLPFAFDRCLELGADTIIIKNDKFKDQADMLNSASEAGYKPVYKSDKIMVLRLPFNYTFGTKPEYEGLGIGKYAPNLAYMFPQLQTGGSYFIDDYTQEQLSKYRVIFLSGFEYRNKSKAEALIKTVSQKGVKVIIDMTGAQPDVFSSRPEFLGVSAQPVQFNGKYPLLEFDNNKIDILNSIPKEYSRWKTEYLENLDGVQGNTYYSNQNMNFIGTKFNQNIEIMGFNLPFFALQTKDESVIKLLEQITGLKENVLPERRIIRLDINNKNNVLDIKAESRDTLTPVSALDSFASITGTYESIHNLIYMKNNELKIRVNYPYLAEGIGLSTAGLAAVFLLLFVSIKKKKEILL
ncbi:MAG: 6-pyruvoyl-tetrahydropterin synthase-related protein [Bacillota bacterium]|nr:6-pyruvoyl-tetrahydropterin synthase-related protein [Bacillota bacterium]